jgi:hypothetical protein
MTGAVALALLLLASAATALTPLGDLRYAPDITVDLSGTTVDHNEVAEDDLAGNVSLVNIGAIPKAAIVTAYDRLANGDQLLSFDIDVELAGGLAARRGDVVSFDGTNFTLLFDAAANGIPRGVITDAVSAIGPADLLLSFDVTVALGAVTAHNSDVVRFQGGVFSIFFDGAAAGVAPGLDLDALNYLPGNGHLLLSFDVSGVLGGVSFNDEDVLEYTPGAGTFELAYNGLSEHAGWFGGDLQALAEVPTPTPSETPSQKPTDTATSTPTPTSTPTGVLPNGDPCTTAAECQSGFCADRVCCDRACDGPMQRCNVEGEVGTCVPVASAAPAASNRALLLGVLVLVALGLRALSRRERIKRFL